MVEYHKIETLFERDEKTKKLIEGNYRNETVRFLENNYWDFTEKIDGTNIRALNGKRLYNANIEGDYIYYVNENGSDAVFHGINGDLNQWKDAPYVICPEHTPEEWTEYEESQATEPPTEPPVVVEPAPIASGE